MSSMQSQLIYQVMRNRHLLRFQLKRETWDWNTSIARFRQECEDGAKKTGKLPDGIEVFPVEIPGLPDGLSAEWILPSQAVKDRIIFYIHGGGYVSGSCSDHRAMVAKIVKCSQVGALLFDYRLAPENSYPAALDDTLTAYQWLLGQEVSSARIVIVGNSAGGGLALSALLALRDRGIPLPAAAIAISPITDLKLTGQSHRTRESVCVSPPGMAVVCSKYYAGDSDPALPYMSPLYGDLTGLPPLLISVGDYDTLLDDSTRFAAKATDAGANVTLRVGEKMVHCYPLMAPLFPEASQALIEICDFIRAHLD